MRTASILALAAGLLAAGVRPSAAAANPCDSQSGGVFPEVAFFQGKLWCAVQAHQTLHLVSLSESKAVLSAKELPLRPGSLAFPRMWAEGATLWLAYRDFDTAKLRDVVKEAEQPLGPSGGNDPIAMGGGFVAWQAADPAFTIRRRKLSGGEETAVGPGRPTGLSRVMPDGRVALVDDDRLAVPEGTRPCWAGGLTALEAPDRGVLAKFSNGTGTKLFPGKVTYTPRCAANGSSYAVTSWGDGWTYLAVFRGSGGAADTTTAAAPPEPAAASSSRGGMAAQAPAVAPAPPADPGGGAAASGAGLKTGGVPAALTPPAPSSGTAGGSGSSGSSGPSGGSAGSTAGTTLFASGPRNGPMEWDWPEQGSSKQPPVNTCDDAYRRCAREGKEDCMFGVCRGVVWMVRNTNKALSCKADFWYHNSPASQWQAWAGGIAQEVLEACKDVCHVGSPECPRLPAAVDKVKLLESFERYWSRCISYKGISCICNPNEGVCKQFKRFMKKGTRHSVRIPEGSTGTGSGGSGAVGGHSGGGGSGKKKHAPQRCKMPNRKAVVEEVLARPGMAEALKRACRNNTDWTFPDAVIDELRKTDRRWGYLCRRGKCEDPSHDVLAYYCGSRSPRERSDKIAAVDYITASCYDKPEDGNPGIGWGLLEPNPDGTPGWTSRGRF